MAEGLARFDSAFSYIFDRVVVDDEAALEIGGRQVAEFIALQSGLGTLSWLALIEPPSDVTEFRFVISDDSYEGGFRTSTPFSTDQTPAEVAEGQPWGEQVVRVIYGRSE